MAAYAALMTNTVNPRLLERALVEEAAKKSALVWVQGTEGSAVALWHVWHDGAVCLVGGGPGEQPLRGLADGGTATVTIRSKDTWGRLVAFQAQVTEVAPHEEAWQTAVDELKGKRLNAPDADTMPERWARECRVLRLEPTGPVTEKPGAMPDDGGAAVPVPTTATTRRPIPAGLPRLLLRRRSRKG